MIVYCVDVYVKAGHEEDFIRETGKNRIGTRKEEGNLRFDLSKSADTEGLFFLYEVYADEQAVASHKETVHYLQWRESVAPWMEKPRNGRMYKPLLPGEESEWK